MSFNENVEKAAHILSYSKRTTVFTGAGISVESGIPPFRGKGGLWETYDPYFIDIEFFKNNPEESWKMIVEILYDKIRGKKPNFAHDGVTLLQKKGLVETIITQNIDFLHQESGSQNVYEFHGNSKFLVCLSCSSRFEFQEDDLKVLPPLCMKCGGLLKPDFVFFGEPIPVKAMKQSFYEAGESDVVLVIGTSGEVMPACSFPFAAKSRGARIIEINTEPSSFTGSISDVFIENKATSAMKLLLKVLCLE
ncbi:NAD-dependent deacylase [candidate division WOR-3 bacterium]|nr:NAD-dependent deacylase [candidate division WOR-3 bacterium]